MICKLHKIKIILKLSIIENYILKLIQGTIFRYFRYIANYPNDIVYVILIIKIYLSIRIIFKKYINYIFCYNSLTNYYIDVYDALVTREI